ncbi:MAG: LytR C-terminal domain-containing protein [Gemmatimonadota bacterium]|nr:LytR C-terminal domain-containing protein [Gemmatimonadota bacterium]
MAILGAVLMVAVLLGSAWWGWRASREPVDPAEDPFGSQLELPLEAEAYARVEVLNGTGEPGVAQQAAEVLRRGGFDVVYFGNAGSFDILRTKVIDRVGSRLLADSVARWLGVHTLEVDPDVTLYLDATIILGRDWRERLHLVPDSAAGR